MRRKKKNILVPFAVGPGGVSEDVADGHPHGKDGLADVGAIVPSCIYICNT
jgi:hypothetical protein